MGCRLSSGVVLRVDYIDTLSCEYIHQAIRLCVFSSVCVHMYIYYYTTKHLSIKVHFLIKFL